MQWLSKHCFCSQLQSLTHHSLKKTLTSHSLNHCTCKVRSNNKWSFSLDSSFKIWCTKWIEWLHYLRIQWDGKKQSLMMTQYRMLRKKQHHPARNLVLRRARKAQHLPANKVVHHLVSRVVLHQVSKLVVERPIIIVQCHLFMKYHHSRLENTCHSLSIFHSY
jgi:hypothetical protein